MFHRVRTPYIASALTALALLSGPASADDLHALSTVAQTDGFTYTWISTEAAAALTRPGVTVLVRAGNPRYEVNDAVRYLDRAPVYRQNDLLIGPELDRTLAALAAAHPWPRPASVAAATPATTGTITTTAAFRPGTSTIVVAGTAPANAPLVVTLSAQLSSQLPTVVVARTNATADADGRYVALVPAASVFLSESVFTATVEAGRGVTPGSATLKTAAPNPSFETPNDRLSDK